MTKEKHDPNETKRDKSHELFYLENGLMVFTEKFHLQRGYCCKSGCRHCPYGFQKNPQASGISE